jgi:hypothetical protein
VAGLSVAALADLRLATGRFTLVSLDVLAMQFFIAAIFTL